MNMCLNALACALALSAAAAANVYAAETPTVPVKVIVTAKGCDPMQLTVPAGTTVFQIVNKSTRALEWEILKGVMVVAERENIAPGFNQKLTATLEAGEYAITCGLLSNPQGKLTVTGSTTTEAAAKPTAADLIGPSAEYRVYLYNEVATLTTAAAALADAVTAGDLAKATDRFAAAYAAYLHLKPAVALFGDLDKSIDGDTTAGFPKLASGLLAAKSTADLAPVAASLNAEVAKLQAQLKSASATPEITIKGAAQVIAAIAHDAPEAKPVLQAKLDGARKVVDLFGPIIARTDKASADRIAADLADIDQKLNADSDRKALGEALAVLADHVSHLTVTLGLSQS